jgi:8-oxo-dGTP pyrophosphatase MutT (NUDIX family)
MPKEKSIGAIVFHKENFETKFLLLHYKTGHWDFPKGHVEENETEEQTLWRELEEETAINKKKAKIVPGFQERITYFYKQKNETMFKEVIFFLVESQTAEVKISPEHKAFEWHPFEQALKKITFANAKQTLKKAREFLNQKTLGGFG